MHTPSPSPVCTPSSRRTGARTALTLAAACAVLGTASVLCLAPANAVPTPENACTPDPTSFAYTGEPQTFTVPAGVASVDIAISGASGGAYIIPPSTYTLPGEEPISDPGRTWTGGTGAQFVARSVSVDPGESLTVVVGGAGVDTTSLYGGGTGQGGGGGSFVYSAPTADGLLAAAGGGGGSGYGIPGVDASINPAGSGLGGAAGAGNSDGGGGGGAGFLAVGAGGGQGDAPGGHTNTGGDGGQAAPTFAGGTGGSVVGLGYPATSGGFGGGGGGGAGSYMGGGGGGGGGYTGGKGGAGGTAQGGVPQGGTGGTSYAPGATTVVGPNTGNGAVTISAATATATYDTQGGSTAPESEVTRAGCAISAPGNPIRSGYEFAGWFTAPTGGTSWDFAAPVTADTTLYARWTAPVRTDPEISARLISTRPKSPSGWYRTPVTVGFTCTTHGASLVDGCPAPVQLTSSARGQSVSRTIIATDDGTASLTVTGINIDLTDPSLRVAGVRAGATYAVAPRPVCRATDTVSGVASCRITHRVLSRGVHVDVHSYRAVATDRAGNVHVTSGRYSVRRA